MTYLQLMIKCLTFFKDQKEEFDRSDFYIHWLANDEDGIDLYYKSKAKKALMYLLLLETKKSTNVNIPLLDLLERELSFFDVSLCKTLEKVEQKTIESVSEDPYMFDQVCLLQLGELTEDEQSEVFNELSTHFQNQISKDWEVEQYESAIHNVMEMVSQILPELLFTQRGYEYIGSEYQINDPEFRKSCYEYLKSNIRYYNDERIYKVDENVYNKLCQEDDEFEDDYDEFDEESDEFDDEYEEDDDEIRGQVDIYGDDIDNYDILFYSVILSSVMLRFIKDKQYDKVKKIIEIDDIITDDYSRFTFDSNCDKTIIEALYQPKTMGEDYYQNIAISAESDSYLDFFLSNNEFTQKYNLQQLSLIIAHCFDFLDSNPLDKMVENSNMIDNVFASNVDKEEKIKELVKIRQASGE